MVLPLKPICERKDMRRDGTSLVYIQYCYSSEHRTNLNTEIAIPPDHCIKKTQRIACTLPENFGDFQALNEEINRMSSASLSKIKLVTKQLLLRKHLVPALMLPPIQKEKRQISQVLSQRKYQSNKLIGRNGFTHAYFRNALFVFVGTWHSKASNYRFISLSFNFSYSSKYLPGGFTLVMNTITKNLQALGSFAVLTFI